MDIVGIRNILRQGESNSLKRRRWISLLSAIGIIEFTVISLYQVGLIRSLPDFPGKIFDSDNINASGHSYQMGAPDGPISLGVYTLNLMLASYKGGKKAGRPKFADITLAGAVLANAAGAEFYLKTMVTEQKKACLYCITGALLNFASVPFALAELYHER